MLKKRRRKIKRENKQTKTNNVAKIRISGILQNYNYSTTNNMQYFGFGSWKYDMGKATGTVFSIVYNFNYSSSTYYAYLGAWNGGYNYSDSVNQLLSSYQDTSKKSFDLTFNNIVQNPDNTNITIFCVIGSGGYLNNICAFSLIQLFDSSDNLLHELKPAIVNGESGMYDTVTKTFYGNANSVGSLVCE